MIRPVRLLLTAVAYVVGVASGLILLTLLVGGILDVLGLYRSLSAEAVHALLGIPYWRATVFAFFLVAMSAVVMETLTPSPQGGVSTETSHRPPRVAYVGHFLLGGCYLVAFLTDWPLHLHASLFVAWMAYVATWGWLYRRRRTSAADAR